MNSNKKQRANELAKTWVYCKSDETKKKIESEIIDNVLHLINYYVGKSGVTNKQDLRQEFLIKTLKILNTFDPDRSEFLTYLTLNFRKARQDHLLKKNMIRTRNNISVTSLNRRPKNNTEDDEFIDQLEGGIFAGTCDYDEIIDYMATKGVINNEEVLILEKRFCEGFSMRMLGDHFNCSHQQASNRLNDIMWKIKLLVKLEPDKFI